MMEIKSSKIVWFLALFLYMLLYIVNSGRMQPYIIMGFALITFVLYAVLMRKPIVARFDSLVFYYIILCLFCYVSSLWALYNSSLSISMGNALLVNFAPFIVMYLIFNDCLGIRDLLKLIQWGNYFVLVYAILAYGWDTFVYAFTNETRVSNEFLNANVIGMCAAYAVVINVYFILYEGFQLSDVLILPAILILAASGSRKAIIILAVGIFAVFILKNFTIERFLRSVVRIILVILILSIVFLLLSRLSIFDLIRTRMDDLIQTLIGGGSSNSSAGLRMQYNALGLQLFAEHPILGIGIDNAKPVTLRIYGYYHYLHDNYIELLACGGIVGFVIYYSVYAYLFYIMIKYRKERDKTWDICMILMIIRLAMDVAVVTYDSRSTYIYLLLFWLEAQKLKKGEMVDKIRDQ